MDRKVPLQLKSSSLEAMACDSRTTIREEDSAAAAPPPPVAAALIHKSPKTCSPDDQDSVAEDDDISQLADPIVSFTSPRAYPNTTVSSGAVRRMRGQLWDAYRLCSVILGERISSLTASTSSGSSSPFSNSAASMVFLRAIREVASMREEMEHLQTCLSLCRQREQRHRHNFVTKQDLRDQVAQLEVQLHQQKALHQALVTKHDGFVQTTKKELQELYCHRQRSGSSDEDGRDHQDPSVQDRFARLFAQIAAASVRQKIEAYQTELALSQQATHDALREKDTIQEKLTYEHHIAQLDAALQRAQNVLQKQQDPARQYRHQTVSLSRDLAKAREQLEVIKDGATNIMNPNTTVQTNKYYQMHKSILDLLERTLRAPHRFDSTAAVAAANQELQGTIQELQQRERDALGRVDHLVQEVQVADDEKQQLLSEIHRLEQTLSERSVAFEDELQELTVNLVEAEEYQAKYEVLQEKYDKDIARLTANQKANQERIFALKAQLDDMKHQNADLSKSNRELMRTQARSNQELQDLQDQLAALTSDAIEVEELKTKYADLYLRHDSEVANNKEAQNHVETLKNRLAAMHSQHNNVTKQLEESQRASGQEIESLRSRVEQLTSQLGKADDIKRRVSMFNEMHTVQGVTGGIADSKIKINELENELSDLQTQYSDLLNAKGALEEAHASSIAEVARLSSNLEQTMNINKSGSLGNLSDRSFSTDDERNILDADMLKFAGLQHDRSPEDSEGESDEEPSSLWLLQNALSSDRKLQEAHEKLYASQQRIEQLESQLIQLQDARSGDTNADKPEPAGMAGMALMETIENNEGLLRAASSFCLPERSESKACPESPGKSSASTTSTASTSTAWFSLDSSAYSSASTVQRRNVTIKKLDP